LNLDNAIKAGEVALRQQEYERQKMSILGPLGSQKELNSVIEAINEQIEVLEKILGQTDTSTKQGIIDSNSIKLEISKLRTEEKSLRKELLDAFLSQIVATALGAGKFEKILISSNKNLAEALRIGAVKKNPYLTGSVTPSYRPPIRTEDILPQIIDPDVRVIGPEEVLARRRARKIKTQRKQNAGSQSQQMNQAVSLMERALNIMLATATANDNNNAGHSSEAERPTSKGNSIFGG